MTGTENNKFEILHCTYREIQKHSMYLKKGYNAAEYKSNMTKRIWYHKELKLMMIQYLNVKETEDQTEEENSVDKTEDDQNEEDNKEEPHTEEPPPKEPTFEEPPPKEPIIPEEPPTKKTQLKIQKQKTYQMKKSKLQKSIVYPQMPCWRT